MKYNDVPAAREIHDLDQSSARLYVARLPSNGIKNSHEGKSMRAILVTGALGQIGTELVPALREAHDAEHVIASDSRMAARQAPDDACPYIQLDCTEPYQLLEAARRYEIGTIYHLAALLSATAEAKPQTAWHINMTGLYNVLEMARQYNCRVFFPSSIGAFGPSTPKEQTPQVTIQRPTTIYGITKVSGELLCDYYASRFGVDTRGLRLPGLVSHGAPPGGGTTDFAVDIYYQALRYKHYSCFVSKDTRVNLMYLPDAIQAMISLMAADQNSLRYPNAYNITAMSVTPGEIAAEIAKYIPGFAIDYDVDPVRQAIADSWPRSMDDSAARSDWGWAPRFDLASMTDDMLTKLRAKLTAFRSSD